MRKRSVVYLAVLFVLFGSQVYAQATLDYERMERLKREAAQAEIQREELLNLAQETARAIQLHNGTFFNRVYTDDFLGTSPSGSSIDKAGVISSVQNNPAKYTSFVASDIQIRIYQDTAVTMCLWSSRGTYQGAPFFKQSRVTTVYLYGVGGWKAVARQETQLPG
jgi:hypothetical protein